MSVSEPALAQEQILTLWGRVAPGWVLARPMMVLLELDEDGSYVVSENTFTVYGVGQTTIEAQQDYINSLIEYYELLQKDVASGDPPTQAQLSRLQSYLRPATEQELKMTLQITDQDRDAVSQLLDELSPRLFFSALDYIRYLYERESQEATEELEAIPGFMEGFRRARKQIETGDVVRFEDIRRDV